ncbi:unnamed protein product, partial [Diabrotica balteata]
AVLYKRIQAQSCFSNTLCVSSFISSSILNILVWRMRKNTCMQMAH